MSATAIYTSPSNKQTKALLLGSGELGKEVTIELMRLGVYVIACDRYDNAPAMLVANDKAVIDMRDEEQLTALINKVKPDYVIPEIEAISTKTLIKLESQGVHVVPSAKAADITMNRESIRTLAAEELSLPTSPYFFASTLDEIKENIHKVGLPCIIKPVMSSSGKGQSTVKHEGDIEKAWEYACSAGRGGINRVIVEGMVKFDREITLLTVSAVDGIHFCEAIGHRQEKGDYRESWQPEILHDETLLECKRIASSVVKALGGYGLFGVELFICGDKVVFSELSPRPHDTGMVTMISQDLSEFALHVRALLGLPVGKITFMGPSASAALLVEGNGHDLCFDNIKDALASEHSTQLRIFGKPEVVGERRMGVALCRAPSVKEALEGAIKVRDAISVEIK